MMKKMIGYLSLIGCIGMLLVGCGDKKNGSGNTQWDEVKSKGELVIGIDDTFVPMGFRDEQDNIVGFDIDLAKEVTKEMGVRPKFQAIDWSMKETELENGTIDVIWNGYTVTDARKKKVDFSSNYLNNQQVLVSLKKNNVKTFSDMTGKILGAQEGSSGADSFENNPELLKDYVSNNEAILFPTFTEAFLDLEAGRIDALLIDKVFAEYYISQQKDKNQYVVSTSDFEDENFAIGVKKDETEMLDKINDGLKKAYEDGLSKKVSEKWFGEDRVIKP